MVAGRIPVGVGLGADSDMALTVGSLFSGIGGIDLGLERAGMVTRWFCEIDPHCRNVLARHWPGLPIYGDITAVDWSGVERVDVLAGGFPCQPVSNAGKRLGTDDVRWLWPEFARAIRALRPLYVLVENVAALLGRGFGEVVTDLAALGYDAEWDCIPAAAVGAPHLRDRLWIIAHARSEQHEGGGLEKQGAGAARLPSADSSQGGRGPSELDVHAGQSNSDGRSTLLADPECQSVRGRHSLGGASRAREGERSQRQRVWIDARAGGSDVADPDGARHSLTRDTGTIGTSSPGIFEGSTLDRDSWWATEPNMGRVAHGVPHRVDRLRSLGNAVVPQVVEFIGRRIVAFDEGRVAA